MNHAGFNPSHWSHWLLIGCFLGLSIWGLSLSWRWRQLKRERAKLVRRLAIERHGVNRSSQKKLRTLASRSAIARDE